MPPVSKLVPPSPGSDTRAADGTAVRTGSPDESGRMVPVQDPPMCDHDSPKTDIPDLWPPGSVGSKVHDWESVRRPELLELFSDCVYGRTPTGGRLDGVTVVSRRADALDGRAVRIEADIRLAGPVGSRKASLLLYAPRTEPPAPAFLGLNFQGNHATTPERDVRVSTASAAVDAVHRREPTPRGAEQRRWPMASIVQRGYAIATVWYEELEIDLPGFARSGVRGMFPRSNRRRPDDWGAIGGWAWSLSRILDALAEIPEVDHHSVIAVGHSRLGKTALWAAAQDERFAGVISNESGCGGASLFRHHGVEDIDVITSARPHWFAPAFSQYRGADETLPVDQHQLLALQAPRLTHVGSATRDLGADPVGEFLSTLYASPIFESYGLRGTRTGTDPIPAHPAGCDQLILPPSGTLIGGRLSYHLRDGDHDMLAEDWTHILDSADRQLGRTGRL